MYCYLPESLRLFYSFRRELNEAKAVLSRVPLCYYDAPITSQVSSNVVKY